MVVTRALLLFLLLLTPRLALPEDPLLPGGAAPEGLFLGSFEAAMVIADVGAWRRLAIALAQETNDGRRLLARGISEHVIGRDAAARESLARALELGADRASACFHLAMALRASGRGEDALGAFECAREAAPSELAVLEQLARTQRETGRPLDAVATLEAAWSLAALRGPGDERRVLLELVPLSLRAGPADSGRAAAARLVVLAPEQARAWYWQALVLERVDAVGVEEALERAAALSAEPSLRVEIARVYRRHGEDEIARVMLEEAAEAAPELAAPHEVLGDHWRDAGHLGWALDAWRRAVHRDPALRPEIMARITRLDPALARRFEASLAVP